MKAGTLIALTLFVALAVDVAYGIVTYNTQYGCKPLIETAQPAQNTQANLHALADPCFYVYFYGIVGGSIFVIMLLPKEKK